jgi:hypothetical protein
MQGSLGCRYFVSVPWFFGEVWWINLWSSLALGLVYLHFDGMVSSFQQIASPSKVVYSPILIHYPIYPAHSPYSFQALYWTIRHFSAPLSLVRPLESTCRHLFSVRVTSPLALLSDVLRILSAYLSSFCVGPRFCVGAHSLSSSRV